MAWFRVSSGHFVQGPTKHLNCSYGIKNVRDVTKSSIILPFFAIFAKIITITFFRDLKAV